MNFKELVTAVSVENQLPARVSRDITTSILKHFARCIDEDQPLQTPIIAMRVISLPEREVTDAQNGGTKLMEAAKYGRLTVRKPKN